VPPDVHKPRVERWDAPKPHPPASDGTEGKDKPGRIEKWD
jgi:hypothetical protein